LVAVRLGLFVHGIGQSASLTIHREEKGWWYFGQNTNRRSKAGSTTCAELLSSPEIQLSSPGDCKVYVGLKSKEEADFWFSRLLLYVCGWDGIIQLATTPITLVAQPASIYNVKLEASPTSTSTDSDKAVVEAANAIL
jgi:hypothetical protein